MTLTNYYLTIKGLAHVFSFLFFPFISFSATFTVSNLSDSGAGSLRQAITDANAAAGSDLIHFSVSGTIAVLSPLPAITDQVHMDGSTAPGYISCGAPVVAVQGATGGAGNGIQILGGGSGSIIEALNVQNFPLNGIQLIGSTNCQITACFIGTNLAGTAAQGNGLNGVQIEGSASNNTVGGSAICEGNLISGNGGAGVSTNNSTGSVITGNIIGLTIAGSAAIANASGGVFVLNGSNNTRIGGSLLTERNIVSGNGSGLTGNGLNLDSSTGCIVLGNYIGLDITGATGIGNAENGVSLNACSNATLGGSGINEGNLIADHNFHGIVLNGASNNCTIQGNTIGTNLAETTAIGNDDSGVIVINSSGTIIGGTGVNEGNVLSGSLSEFGIFMIVASGATIQGNYIGTDRTGTVDLGNFGGGIRFDFGAGSSTVGGTATGATNVIAFNDVYGVGVLNTGSNQVLISRNSMYCNGTKGIDLAGVGNANNPSPVITALNASGCSGTASANQNIELFYDSTCVAPCQGKNYIATVTANGAGAWSYVGALTGDVVAVAIDPATNNTSEFSNCNVALPVEFGDFDGENKPYGNELNWSTLSERNADYFVVERSTDGQEWTPVGWVSASGNSNLLNNYQWIDQSFSKAMNYYRLMQYDYDGTQMQHDHTVSIDNRIQTEATLIGTYNLLGQKIDPSSRGIQIRRYSDGTSERMYQD